MSLFNTVAIILFIAMVITYINHRFIKLHTTIATMAAALIVSIIISLLNHIGLHEYHHEVREFVAHIDFHKLVMNFMLGLLLFAGSLTIDLTQLKQQRLEIGVLAFVSTIASAFIIATVLYYLLQLFGVPMGYAYCLLFGSLISPTDPIAVLAIFKQVGAPKNLETAVSAEALFNDGVGVVLFITAYHVAFGGGHVHAGDVIWLFCREAIGGLIYGIVFGYILCVLLRPLRDMKLEIMFSIIMVIAAYALAQSIEISGPLAMVAAGIFVANFRRHETLLPLSRHYMENIWEMIDEILNTVLFLLLGFEILVVNYDWTKIIVSLCVIALTLLVRYLVVALPMTALRPWRQKIPYSISILSWGGLRGGLAVALALALPAGEIRSWILALTYAVVVFSILVQGTTIKPLVRLSRR